MDGRGAGHGGRHQPDEHVQVQSGQSLPAATSLVSRSVEAVRDLMAAEGVQADNSWSVSTLACTALLGNRLSQGQLSEDCSKVWQLKYHTMTEAFQKS